MAGSLLLHTEVALTKFLLVIIRATVRWKETVTVGSNFGAGKDFMVSTASVNIKMSAELAPSEP